MRACWKRLKATGLDTERVLRCASQISSALDYGFHDFSNCKHGWSENVQVSLVMIAS